MSMDETLMCMDHTFMCMNKTWMRPMCMDGFFLYDCCV
jgi:hypothetical protein